MISSHSPRTPTCLNELISGLNPKGQASVEDKPLRCGPHGQIRVKSGKALFTNAAIRADHTEWAFKYVEGKANQAARQLFGRGALQDDEVMNVIERHLPLSAIRSLTPITLRTVKNLTEDSDELVNRRTRSEPATQRESKRGSHTSAQPVPQPAAALPGQKSKPATVAPSAPRLSAATLVAQAATDPEADADVIKEFDWINLKMKADDGDEPDAVQMHEVMQPERSRPDPTAHEADRTAAKRTEKNRKAPGISIAD